MYYTKSPGTVVNDESVGSFSWYLPENAMAFDNEYAMHENPGTPGATNYLKATHFNFQLPSGYPILGIKAEVWNYNDGTNGGDYSTDYQVRIIKGGTIGTAERANRLHIPDPAFYVPYGGQSDLWGETWTTEDINGTGFGLVYSVEDFAGSRSLDSIVNVDHIRLTVYIRTMTMRVSLPGYNAGTDTNIDHFALYSDVDNVLIKEKSRGTITIANGSVGTINHGLGYIPTTFAYGQFSNGKYAQVLSDPIGTFSNANMYADGTNIYISNTSAGTVTFKYVVFYDKQI